MHQFCGHMILEVVSPFASSRCCVRAMTYFLRWQMCLRASSWTYWKECWSIVQTSSGLVLSLRYVKDPLICFQSVFLLSSISFGEWGIERFVISPRIFVRTLFDFILPCHSAGFRWFQPDANSIPADASPLGADITKASRNNLLLLLFLHWWSFQVWMQFVLSYLLS